MSRPVRHSDRVARYLRSDPQADEVRKMVALIARGQAPPLAMTALDDRGTSVVILTGSRRCVWWHSEGNKIVIDDIGDP